MDWTLADYLAAALLIGVAVTMIIFVLRLTRRLLWRIVGTAVILAGLALVWAELAVGIFS